MGTLSLANGTPFRRIQKRPIHGNISYLPNSTRQDSALVNGLLDGISQDIPSHWQTYGEVKAGKRHGYGHSRAERVTILGEKCPAECCLQSTVLRRES